MNQLAKFFLSASFIVTACLLSGCEPAPPSREELGRIEFNPSKVPGADKPYTLPQYLRDAPPAEEKEGRKPGE